LQWKHTIVVKENVMFTIEQAMKVQRESSGITVPFCNLGARWGWMVNAMLQPLYPPAKRPSTHYTGGWLGTVTILDRCGKSHPHWFNSHPSNL
jgi:hypothetical protein